MVAAILILGAGPAAASPDDVANRVASNVMSPYCPGLTLHDCPSDASLELRERIGRWAEAGWTYERIVAELEAEYGEEALRATPPARGLGLVAWALPALALLAGGAIAVSLARRWWGDRAAREGAGAPTPVATAEERARLDAELDRMRSDA